MDLFFFLKKRKLRHYIILLELNELHDFVLDTNKNKETGFHNYPQSGSKLAELAQNLKEGLCSHTGHRHKCGLT